MIKNNKLPKVSLKRVYVICLFGFCIEFRGINLVWVAKIKNRIKKIVS